MERTCLYCNDPLSGRVDKKFCSDQCRNAYNNERIAGNENHIRRINAVLKKNRKILEQILATENKKVIPLEGLIQSGFNFQFHTFCLTTKNGNTYFFCYEFGYLKLEHDKVMLVKRDRFEY